MNTLSQSQVDKLNQKTMRSSVRQYSNKNFASESELDISEKIALADIGNEIKDKRILDIGVGGGRTVKALLDVSKNYIGIDYVEKMVISCRKTFPGIRFETMDARSMAYFSDNSFELIVFSCGGISMVDHEGRIAILNEVYRLLSPGGIFICSTYNRNSLEHNRFFILPKFKMTLNVPLLAKRTVFFGAHLAFSMFNRMRYKNRGIFTSEYSIVNDNYHDYRTMIYYINLDEQKKQLEQVGFKSDICVYSTEGVVEKDDNKLGRMLLYVARR